jgi:hypothetical protein
MALVHGGDLPLLSDSAWNVWSAEKTTPQPSLGRGVAVNIEPQKPGSWPKPGFCMPVKIGMI